MLASVLVTWYSIDSKKSSFRVDRHLLLPYFIKEKGADVSLVYLYNDDCVDFLRSRGDNEFDSSVMDPPAGIGFMGNKWDSDKGGRDHWVGWMTEVMSEVHRVHKPGAYTAVWTLPRTSHWTATAIEDAGFYIVDGVSELLPSNDVWHDFLSGLTSEQYSMFVSLLTTDESRVSHLFGTGYPSGLNIVNAIVRANEGITQEQLAQYMADSNTGLKPAREDWILARKNPTTVSSADISKKTGMTHWSTTKFFKGKDLGKWQEQGYTPLDADPKFKAPYFIFTTRKSLTESEDTIDILVHKEGETVVDRRPYEHWTTNSITANVLVYGTGGLDLSGSRLENGNHPTNVVVYHSSRCEHRGGGWKCVPECPVNTVSEQKGSDASGIFTSLVYQAKPTRKEKDLGLDDLPLVVAGGMQGRKDGSLDGHISMGRNNHPTVKPLQLMRKAVRMLTPPGGRTLDPFLGSGTTGAAAVYEGYAFSGSESELSSYEIAYRRIMYVLREVMRSKRSNNE